MKKKLLLNWVYYRPVGHVVEALKHAQGYASANRNVDVYLLLNDESPTEIAAAYSWVKKVYPISLNDVIKHGEKAKTIKSVPKVWDYVITDDRAKVYKKGWDEVDLMKTQDVLQRVLRATIAKGYIDENILPYASNLKLELTIPTAARKFAKRYSHKGVSICIMLGGSAGAKQSPALKSWLKICQALYANIPDLKIYFTGVTQSERGRTTTYGFTLKSIHHFAGRLPNAEVAYNIGLWNQLALIQQCDIFLSPHTGFAFLAPLVGTPWLVISTCRWNEYIFNNIPFYSVLPECGYYPAQGETKRGCGKLLVQGKRALCVTDKLLERKIPEIISGAKMLLDPKFTYARAWSLHLHKIHRPPYIYKKFLFLDGPQGLGEQVNKRYLAEWR